MVVDLPGRMPARPPMGAGQGDRLVDAVRLCASPRREAARQRAPHDRMPHPGLQVGVLPAGARRGDSAVTRIRPPALMGCPARARRAGTTARVRPRSGRRRRRTRADARGSRCRRACLACQRARRSPQSSRPARGSDRPQRHNAAGQQRAVRSGCPQRRARLVRRPGPGAR
jgi:hypothetical protein